jgi:hypothetical protein
MEAWIHAQLGTLLALLALPEVGLSTVFVVSLVSATLLPLGSEPAVFGLVKLNPAMFWPAVPWPRWATPSAAPSAGGWATAPSAPTSGSPTRAARCAPWLAAALRAQGLPAVVAARRGRPAVRGGRLAAAALLALRGYMAIGKFLRYITMTAALLWVFPSAAG